MRFGSRNTVSRSPGVATTALRDGLSVYWPTPVQTSATVTVTANATPHVKGSWSELITSTTNRTSAIIVKAFAVSTSNTATDQLIDIGIGGAGSETVVVANIPAGGAANPGGVYHMIPVFIPAGTRVAARSQAIIGGDTVSVNLTVCTAIADDAASYVDTIGADTATSAGVVLSGTSGSYTEITSATTQHYRGLILCPAFTGNAGASQLATITLAVGGAGSETDILVVPISTGSAETIDYMTCNTMAMLSVPSGTRLSAKHNTNNVQNDISVVVLGIPYG